MSILAGLECLTLRHSARPAPPLCPPLDPAGLSSARAAAAGAITGGSAGGATVQRTPWRTCRLRAGGGSAGGGGGRTAGADNGTVLTTEPLPALSLSPAPVPCYCPCPCPSPGPCPLFLPLPRSRPRLCSGHLPSPASSSPSQPLPVRPTVSCLVDCQTSACPSLRAARPGPGRPSSLRCWPDTHWALFDHRPL